MTVNTPKRSRPEHRRRPVRLGCAVVAGLLLVAILYLSFRLVSAGLAARSALSELRALQSVDLNVLTNLDGSGLGEVRGHFAELETDLDTVHKQGVRSCLQLVFLAGCPR